MAQAESELDDMSSSEARLNLTSWICAFHELAFVGRVSSRKESVIGLVHKVGCFVCLEQCTFHFVERSGFELLCGYTANIAAVARPFQKLKHRRMSGLKCEDMQREPPIS